MLIEIVRDDGPLARKRWTFMIAVASHSPGDPIVLRLRDYIEEARPSKRHRTWQPLRAYRFGLGSERSRVAASGAEWVAEPPCPEDVKAEALRELTSRVEFQIGHLGALRDG